MGGAILLRGRPSKHSQRCFSQKTARKLKSCEKQSYIKQFEVAEQIHLIH